MKQLHTLWKYPCTVGKELLDYPYCSCRNVFKETTSLARKIRNANTTFLVTGMVLLILGWSQQAKAQIKNGFELDGNATSVGQNSTDDWDLIYNGTSSAQVTSGVISD